MLYLQTRCLSACFLYQQAYVLCCVRATVRTRAECAIVRKAGRERSVTSRLTTASRLTAPEKDNVLRGIAGASLDGRALSVMKVELCLCTLKFII